MSASSSQFYVLIIDYGTETVQRCMGPNSQCIADRIDSGVQHNLDHERFYTLVVNGDDSRVQARIVGGKS